MGKDQTSHSSEGSQKHKLVLGKQLKGGAHQEERHISDDGVFFLCLANVVLFLSDHVAKIASVRRLYLHHLHPKPWQFLTSGFCHLNWNHLTSNIFLLYVFGKIVEEEIGASGVILTYLVGVLGSFIANYLTFPANSVSMGSSGAVFSLFVVAVLIKMRWSVKKLLEAGILGHFVYHMLVKEVSMQVAVGAGGGRHRVGHIAHLAGASAGGILILLSAKLSK